MIWAVLSASLSHCLQRRWCLSGGLPSLVLPLLEKSIAVRALSAVTKASSCYTVQSHLEGLGGSGPFTNSPSWVALGEKRGRTPVSQRVGFLQAPQPPSLITGLIEICQPLVQESRRDTPWSNPPQVTPAKGILLNSSSTSILDLTHEAKGSPGNIPRFPNPLRSGALANHF